MTNNRNVYLLKPDVVFEPMDDDAIIVGLGSEEIYKLNSTGTQIVKLLAERRSVQEIITALGELYDVDNRAAEKEVLDLLNDLLNANLIEEFTGQ